MTSATIGVLFQSWAPVTCAPAATCGMSVWRDVAAGGGSGTRFALKSRQRAIPRLIALSSPMPVATNGLLSTASMRVNARPQFTCSLSKLGDPQAKSMRIEEYAPGNHS